MQAKDCTHEKKIIVFLTSGKTYHKVEQENQMSRELPAFFFAVTKFNRFCWDANAIRISYFMAFKQQQTHTADTTWRDEIKQCKPVGLR